MSGELPEGWVRVQLAELTADPTSITYGVLKPGPVNTAGVPMLRVTDIRNGQVDGTGPYKISRDLAQQYNRTKLRGGEVLVSVQGSVGRVAIVPAHLAGANISRTLAMIRPIESSLAKWIWVALQSPQVQSQMEGVTGGTTRDSLNLRDLRVLELPLPPSQEQRRIVAKLERLLNEVNTSQHRLAKVRVLIKRCRQSVLAAAFCGRLTAHWRQRHHGLESGVCLLRRIKAARLKTASRKEKHHIEEAFENESLGMGLDEIDIESIPDSWCACRVGAVGGVVNGSTPSRTRTEFWGAEIPWVSSGEVRNNVITSTRERLTQAGYESCAVRLLPAGTVLLAMIGEGKTRGQSAILEIEATINQNVAAVILPHGLVNSAFLWLWFHFQYESTRKRGSGSGPQALNCQRVRELPFVLPPLAEQVEIVRRVSELFGLVEQLAARVRAAGAQVDRLLPALLAKALRGELVPTETELSRREGRAYEPTSVLLDRLQQERDGNGAGSKASTRSKASMGAKTVTRAARSSRRAALSR